MYHSNYVDSLSFLMNINARVYSLSRFIGKPLYVLKSIYT